MNKIYYSKLHDVLIEMPDIEMASGTGCVFDIVANRNYLNCPKDGCHMCIFAEENYFKIRNMTEVQQNDR